MSSSPMAAPPERSDCRSAARGRHAVKRRHAKPPVSCATQGAVSPPRPAFAKDGMDKAAMRSWFHFVLKGNICERTKAINRKRRSRQAGRGGFDVVVPNPKRKLLARVRELLRLRHSSIRTEQS